MFRQKNLLKGPILSLKNWVETQNESVINPAVKTMEFYM